MTNRTSLLAMALLFAATTPSIALAARWQDARAEGAQSATTVQSTAVSRAAAPAPAERVERSAPSYDGWRFVGGEAGWVFVSARFEVVDGRLVHAGGCQFKPALATLTPPVRPATSDKLYGGA